ncbi:MAG: ribosome assembly cofactor RimP [Flavobacteriales bacterium]
MLNKEHITMLANEALEGTENYLIEVKVSSRNKIIVLIDSDHSLAIKDCVAVSRYIEHSLDREKEDFELEVSSPGIDQPFRHKRQYKKNVGRNLEVKLENDQTIKGLLVSADDNSIFIQPEKPKKQKTPMEQVSIQLDQIKEAKLIIKI